MVTASMDSRRRSAMTFPATEFTASDNGLAGLKRHKKNRQPLGLRPRACPKLPLRAVDGIAAAMKLAPVHHRSRRQRDQSDCLRAAPLSASCARPSEPEMQEGWRSNLPSGAMANAAFSPPGPATIASGGRVLAGAAGPPPARGAGARARDRSRRPKRRRRFGSREPGARGLSPRGRPYHKRSFTTPDCETLTFAGQCNDCTR